MVERALRRAVEKGGHVVALALALLLAGCAAAPPGPPPPPPAAEPARPVALVPATPIPRPKPPVPARKAPAKAPAVQAETGTAVALLAPPPPPTRPRFDTDRLVGLTAGAVERILGPPVRVEETPPSRTYHYTQGACALRLHLFMEMNSRSFRTLSYDLNSTGVEPDVDQQCRDWLQTRFDTVPSNGPSGPSGTQAAGKGG